MTVSFMKKPPRSANEVLIKAGQEVLFCNTDRQYVGLGTVSEITTRRIQVRVTQSRYDNVGAKVYVSSPRLIWVLDTTP